MGPKQQLELEHKGATPVIDFAAPPYIARYAPVFWEPVPGTGERIVALVSLEPHQGSSVALRAATHPILSAERLRSLLGRQRGHAAHNVLQQAAEFMTLRQQAGLPLEELEAPFHGFVIGPRRVVRGYGVDQLLDAAVRSVSAFGTAGEMIEDEDETDEKPRHTIKTSAFLAGLKRFVAGNDPDVRSRFERSLRPAPGLPELTVDYAYNKWLLQVTSLPSSKRQAINSLRESQSKLYEIDMIRRHMSDNEIAPVLLVNSDVKLTQISAGAMNEANDMLDRLRKLAKVEGLELVESETVSDAADFILNLK